ncbi:MAG: hypothetical protein LBT46_07020, partial [Planctomycetaceae bacterium]|nr:hypothetical protein [Planctomycetaceae bacterium]
TQVTVEIHHSACDAAGAFRFIEDIFCQYARQQGTLDTDVRREEVKAELLNRRGKYGLTPAAWLRIFPKQFWGLTRAWMFFFNRVRPLIPVKVLLDAPKPHRLFPAAVSKVFDEQETRQIHRRTRDAGLTLNDAALAATFLSMKNFDTCNAAASAHQAAQAGYWRIAVPTNLRTDGDRLMPAANIVSMVFIDRKTYKITDTEAFRCGIHREMQYIKRCHLGLALIHGLRIYRCLFGNFTKMIRRDKCWTTATVSNIGVLFDKLPFPKKDGRIQLGDNLELFSVSSVPPIRPQTLLGVCVLTYANRMSVCVHYDTAVLTQSEAEKLLAGIVNKMAD